MLANQINERSLLLHKELVGKIEITSKVEVNSADDLSLTYTPGVAESCKAIAQMKKQCMTIQHVAIWWQLFQMEQRYSV